MNSPPSTHIYPSNLLSELGGDGYRENDGTIKAVSFQHLDNPPRCDASAQPVSGFDHGIQFR
jgi:hypothetical protein